MSQIAEAVVRGLECRDLLIAWGRAYALDGRQDMCGMDSATQELHRATEAMWQWFNKQPEAKGGE